MEEKQMGYKDTNNKRDEVTINIRTPSSIRVRKYCKYHDLNYLEFGEKAVSFYLDHMEAAEREAEAKANKVLENLAAEYSPDVLSQIKSILVTNYGGTGTT